LTESEFGYKVITKTQEYLQESNHHFYGYRPGVIILAYNISCYCQGDPTP